MPNNSCLQYFLFTFLSDNTQLYILSERQDVWMIFPGH